MMKRLFRRAMRACGIFQPYSDVVCPVHVKSVFLGTESRARVTIRQKLVFLDAPAAGELHDTCSVDPHTSLHDFEFESVDGVEIARRKVGTGTIAVSWKPQTPITPYALYEHEFSWLVSGSQEEPALLAECQLETKTGLLVLELFTPEAFDAAVVFERPRWPPLNSERKIVKYALKQLEAGAERPTILNNGRNVEWRILGPKMGVRYVCVAFHPNGIVLWKERLKKSSFVGGIRDLLARLVPGKA